MTHSVMGRPPHGLPPFPRPLSRASRRPNAREADAQVGRVLRRLRRPVRRDRGGHALLHALLSDYRDVAARVQALKDVEHKGDEVTHTAFNRLHKQFITPFDRDADPLAALAHRRRAGPRPTRRRRRLHYYEIQSSRRRTPPSWRGCWCCAREKVQEVVARAAAHQAAGADPRRLQGHQAAWRRRRTRCCARAWAGSSRAAWTRSPSSSGRRSTTCIETATDKCQDVANVIEGVVLEHS